MAGIVRFVRASRLVALLLELQHRGGCTAAELADVLEVSVRTVYRDVGALQEAGIPLWTETGPGGGVRLVDGWRTRLDGLTGDEAAALFLAGTGSAAAELGLGTVLVAAQRKVLATLPPELQHRADRVRSRFHLDAPGWFHRAEDEPHLAVVAEAVWADRRLDLGYGRRVWSAERRVAEARVVRRRVDPLGLVVKAGTWYLVARHRGQVRTYRVSRITQATVRGEGFERPAGFDLAAWWAASSADFDRSMLRSAVRLRLDGRAWSMLPHVVDPEAAARAREGAAPPDAAGWRVVDLAVESDEVAASQLVALGGGVEVLDPPSVRQALADVGRALAARNAAPRRTQPR
jgi:predicted DNA-binding transcriptional regulator YafY